MSNPLGQSVAGSTAPLSSDVDSLLVGLQGMRFGLWNDEPITQASLRVDDRGATGGNTWVTAYNSTNYSHVSWMLLGDTMFLSFTLSFDLTATGGAPDNLYLRIPGGFQAAGRDSLPGRSGFAVIYCIEAGVITTNVYAYSANPLTSTADLIPYITIFKASGGTWATGTKFLRGQLFFEVAPHDMPASGT